MGGCLRMAVPTGLMPSTTTRCVEVLAGVLLALPVATTRPPLSAILQAGCQRICQEDAESLLRLKLHDPQRHVWSLPQYQRQQHCCHGVAYPDAANQLLRVEIIQGCQDDVFILAVVNDPGR